MFQNLRTIFLCILTIICTYSYSQTDTAKLLLQYKLTYQPDSTNNEYRVSEVFQLLIGRKHSLYISSNQLKRDEFIDQIKQQATVGALTEINLTGLPKSRFQAKIIHKMTSGIVNTYSAILTDKYYYEVDVPKWKLHNQYKMISGYNCQLATCSFGGRDFEVWFTPDIPIQDGPFIFKKLPGLVIFANDVKNHYVFMLENISQDQISKVFNVHEDEATRVQRSEFMQMKIKLRDNSIAMIEQSGFTMDEIKKAAFIQNQQNARKLNNNPLELE